MCPPAEKTNAMRVLDAHGITYAVYTFPPDIHSATGVAETIGVSPGRVYKTLVLLRAQGKPMLVMVAGPREIDLKRLAAAVGSKKLRMATQREAEALTGLQVGGISALALLNRPFEIFIDRPALNLPDVVVSAGKRGINLCLAVDDLVRVTQARVVDATKS